jgi:hypothetical protein
MIYVEYLTCDDIRYGNGYGTTVVTVPHILGTVGSHRYQNTYSENSMYRYWYPHQCKLYCKGTVKKTTTGTVLVPTEHNLINPKSQNEYSCVSAVLLDQLKVFRTVLR